MQLKTTCSRVAPSKVSWLYSQKHQQSRQFPTGMASQFDLGDLSIAGFPSDSRLCQVNNSLTSTHVVTYDGGPLSCTFLTRMYCNLSETVSQDDPFLTEVVSTNQCEGLYTVVQHSFSHLPWGISLNTACGSNRATRKNMDILYTMAVRL